MSFLRRGGRRRGRVATAATTVAMLGAFQALAIVGAGSASAAGSCSYVAGDQRVDVIITAGTGSSLSVSDGSVAGTVAGDILFDGAACGGSPKISNTVRIDVTTTTPSGSEIFVIDNTFGVTSDEEFPSTITWNVDLGTAAGDTLGFLLSGDVDNTLVLTDTSFTLNDGPGTILGVEGITVVGAAGDDVIDGSALGSGVALIALGGGGIDWIAPGQFVGDLVTGGGDVGDTLSYGTRTNSTIIGNPPGAAGFDANGDGVLAAPEEMDGYAGFDTFETGSGNDLLVGTGADEWFIPGDGDDEVRGGGAVTADTVDWSSSSAQMTIDVPNGSATGQGTDDFSGGVAAFVGSDFDDVLLTDGSAPGASVAGFCGGDGVDTVDGSAETGSILINLETLDDWCGTAADDLENAIGGSGNDGLGGNDLRNMLWGNAGDDVLAGFGGNDTMMGGQGNDSYAGGAGADTVDFGDAAGAGIDADVSLGFASARSGGDSGDDSFVDFPEIVKGTSFKDEITGGKTGFGSGVNFRITGRGGNDRLTGSDSNDYLKGGAGNDKLRGGPGDDTLKGGKGKDKAWGGPGTDFCKKVEKAKGCER